MRTRAEKVVILGWTSQPLELNSAQINACARACARRRSDKQPVTANGIARVQSADKQLVTINHIALPILHVSSLISNDVFNTDDHLQYAMFL